jgi:Flp pilus assembly protein CpaB
MSQLLDRVEAPEVESARSQKKRSKRSRKPGLVAGRAAVLPGSRALVGALLCTMAALLTFGAYARASKPPTTTYLVAARNLTPGQSITANDVRAVAMDLPEDQRRKTFGPNVSLIDANILGPVGEGELFQASNVVKKKGGSDSRELSFPIDSAYAAAGRLRVGDRIDVLSNDGTGAVPVATNLLIIATSNPESGVSAGRGTLVITVAYDGTYDGAALLGAAQNAKLSAIRRTGIAGDIRPKANTSTASKK